MTTLKTKLNGVLKTNEKG